MKCCVQYIVLYTGTFSTVKYARLVVKETTRSNWPEYAVKIISDTKIEEFHYKNNVIREMAILKVLGHPNLCRMVSAFKYRGSAYLVLEYASRGDLHNHIINGGNKLSHLQARFVLGEVFAGLTCIHDIGFSYNDLKPENVLITSLGHVKVRLIINNT